jgi:sulfatase maturation enzyme AslB (radical SAM superfamily)
MSLEKNFCPSPWFHMRINNTGNYEYCRWATKKSRQKELGIRDVSPITWFQKNLSDIRLSMLEGKAYSGCDDCYLMEQHGKVSGRQRQLLKIGVRTNIFSPTMHSSPWLPVFDQSQLTGETDQIPQDWQIDLGNYCNSACLFCGPHSSSRLASEFKRIGIISKLPPASWCDDPAMLERFIEMLRSSSRLVYLHFIGGETIITPAFKLIIQALIDSKLNQQVSIGFTVNLTTWDDATVELLTQFKQVNLGMSIECLHPVNDYVRYGSQLDKTKEIMLRWIEVANANNWLTQIRPTPTILTVLHLDTIYDFAAQHQLTVESCNFLNDPAYMRPTVLPKKYRQQVIDRLSLVASRLGPVGKDQIINTRNANFNLPQLVQDINSYINYLTDAPDESGRLPELVAYIKQMEASRNNNVLNYLPEYEELLRTAGY